MVRRLSPQRDREKPIRLTDMLPSQIFDGFFNKPKERAVNVIGNEMERGKF